jgi:predicted Zn-dependent protease
MVNFLLFGSAASAFIIYKYGLTPNPYTGRKELILLPHRLEIYLGDLATESILTEHAGKFKDTSSPEHILVDAVTRKLIEHIPIERQWKVNVIESPVVNAFVVPNGNIFVYTGFLQVLDNVDELGMALGHELAHVYLRHGASKLSISFALQGLWLGLQMLVLGDIVTTSSLPFDLVGNLPFERNKEIEADQCGMVVAVNSGYRIDASNSMLSKLSSAESTLAELFSTHPICEHRVKASADLRIKLMNQYSAAQIEDRRKAVLDTDQLFTKYRASAPKNV